MHMDKNNLTSYLKEFQTKRDLRKIIIPVLVVLFALEIILGLIFNKFLSETFEEYRKENYTKSWEKYLEQKWKYDSSKVSGYVWWKEAWDHLHSGNLAFLDFAFHDDKTMRDDFDLFEIYTQPGGQAIYHIDGKNASPPSELNSEVLSKLFEYQSGKKGLFHTILELKKGKLHLLTVSALCDDLGNPIHPGIVLLGTEIDNFLRMSEEVIHVKMKTSIGEGSQDSYHSILIENPGGIRDFELRIELEPIYKVRTVILKLLTLFITIQLGLTLLLFFSVTPYILKKKSDEFEVMIRASEELNQELRDKLDQLNEAHLEIEKSETKYKHLIESSKDIIFSFDKDGNILTANKALLELLGFKKKDMIGKHFLELSFNPDESILSFEKELMMEKLNELLENKTSVSFDMTFRTKNNEPLQLGVTWEYVSFGDTYMIFGKASTLSEDSMMKYVESEHRIYILENYITLAEQISQRVTANLVRYLDPSIVFLMRICIREMIINAMEHGNLEIDYQTKTELKSQPGAYFDFIQKRQKDSRFMNRRVIVQYHLKPGKVSFSILDEGNGFDHKKIVQEGSGEADKNFLSHGRGIFMTKNAFDELRYNEKGNRVYLAKYF